MRRKLLFFECAIEGTIILLLCFSKDIGWSPSSDNAAEILMLSWWTFNIIPTVHLLFWCSEQAIDFVKRVLLFKKDRVVSGGDCWMWLCRVLRYCTAGVVLWWSGYAIYCALERAIMGPAFPFGLCGYDWIGLPLMMVNAILVVGVLCLGAYVVLLGLLKLVQWSVLRGRGQ